MISNVEYEMSSIECRVWIVEHGMSCIEKLSILKKKFESRE